MLKKLNLGAGSKLLPDCDNVESDLDLKADFHFDIRDANFPFESEIYDEVYMFHCIEHLEKRHHVAVLMEIRRVLKPEGLFLFSYPDFEKIIKNWQENSHGQRDFWEATIYGRQAYPGDYHVSAIYTDYIRQLLFDVGFHEITFTPEPRGQEFNTVVDCRRGNASLTYEKLLFDEVYAVQNYVKV